MQQRLERLRALQSVTLAEYTKDADKRDLIEHNYRIVAESCSDIALLLVARLGLPEPAHRREVFEVLKNANRLSAELAGKLAEATSTRNRLVHQYLTIDPVKMLDHLQNDVKFFAELAAIAIGWADELDTDRTK
ncbi:MAG TPA: DUF86 domain-containing protein [Anaerolineales bacterium]|nr:DUF86 domain-containing protein [Anaerolineales bacterium]